jgi:hypothetical protein
VEERELYRDLARMIKGELTSADVKRLVSREGFQSFSELCETRLPEDLGKVRIGTRDILTRIDAYRRKQIEIFELWYWADELYNISFNHRIAYEPRAEELITGALSAISVIANDRLFPNPQKTQRSLEYIRACLLRRRKLHLRNIFMRIFEDLEVAHLANKHAGEDEPAAGDAGADGEVDDASRWADVVLLDRPYERGKDIYVDYNWMIAFTVTARSLYEEERAEDASADVDMDAGTGGVCPDCERERRRTEAEANGEGPAPAFPVPGWKDADADDDDLPEIVARPRIRPTPREDGEEIDRVPALRRLVPNFDFERLKPRYLYDGDGIAEIVLETERIGPAEIRYAAKLFCIANRIRGALLDGGPLKTLVVKPGVGKREKTL